MCRPMMRALALAALLAAPAALADSDSDHDAARRALERGEVLPLAEILDIVGRDLQGHLIEIEFETKDARHIYEFKLITEDGRLVELYVDAATGEIVKVKDKGD